MGSVLAVREEQAEAADEQAAPMTFAELIEETTVAEGTYDVPMKSGRKIVVRVVTQYRTMVAMKKREAEILRMIEKKAYPSEWKQYLPIGESVAEMMAHFTRLIVAPKMRDIDVLRLCQSSGVFATALLGKIKIKLAESVPMAESEEIEEEKNGSGPTGSDEDI